MNRLKTRELELETLRRQLTVDLWSTDDEVLLSETKQKIADVDLELSNIRLTLYANRSSYSEI